MARSKSKHRRVQHKIRLHWKKRKERKQASAGSPPTGEGSATKKK
jgi:hypothetical protein